MTRSMIRSLRFAIAMVATSLLLATAAQAGPPLICHTIEIGQSKSLPWISHNWNLSGGETYDTKNLVRDTLEILAPDTVEVEFSDEDGERYAEFALPAEQLIVLHNQGEN